MVPMDALVMALESMPRATAIRSFTSENSAPGRPLNHTSLKLAATASRITTFGICWAWRYRSALANSGVHVISLLLMASARLSLATTWKISLDSTGFVPHQSGLRTITMVCLFLSNDCTLNGPALCSGGPSASDVLNDVGVAFTALGYSGDSRVNRLCHSANGLPNVITASVGVAPCVTDEMST